MWDALYCCFEPHDESMNYRYVFVDLFKCGYDFSSIIAFENSIEDKIKQLIDDLESKIALTKKHIKKT